MSLNGNKQFELHINDPSPQLDWSIVDVDSKMEWKLLLDNFDSFLCKTEYNIDTMILNTTTMPDYRYLKHIYMCILPPYICLRAVSWVIPDSYIYLD